MAKKFTWILSVFLALFLVAIITLYVISDGSEQTSTPAANIESIVEQARDILDPPFHFLFDLKEYEATRFIPHSDLFSAWGVLVLKQSKMREPEASSSKILDALKTKAEILGWRETNELSDIEDIEFGRFQVDEPLTQIKLIRKEARPNHDEPTVYSCKIWISEDAKIIFVSYRIDTE